MFYAFGTVYGVSETKNRDERAKIVRERFCILSGK
jgi:hypothetical protein